jgi:ribonuclease HI
MRSCEVLESSYGRSLEARASERDHEVVADYLHDDYLYIYTDGSMYQGPRAGGMGIIFVATGDDGREQLAPLEIAGHLGTNSNQMELQAAIEALKAIKRGYAPIDASKYKRIVIRTDSQYVAAHYLHPRSTWPLNGWKTRDGNPVANIPQWRELDRLMHQVGVRVEFEWVKGHKASATNKQADKLAKASARGAYKPRLGRSTVRRKVSPERTERGGVGMEGQRLTIRIIEDEWIVEAKLNTYRYEVLSRRSPYFQKVDVIYSGPDVVLKAGHTYRVRVNTDQTAPRVLKLFAEV